MPSAHVVRETAIERTPRVIQLEGMFDLPAAKVSKVEWQVDLPLAQRGWQIGLIVGPSGSGKTTVVEELFGSEIVRGFDWPSDRSVVDSFPSGMGVKEITRMLGSVGFSSPPSWLRPFRVLSNGEKFRVTIARALAEAEEFVVVDEFTSVVDRTVAQIGSAAVAKAVRRGEKKFIAVSCHYDVEEWLQPDWVYQPHTGEFHWRSVQRHPEIEIELRRVHYSSWELFRQHHYLTGKLNRSAHCYVAFWGEVPVAFTSMKASPGASSGWRLHRTVVLPDYQGVRIGVAIRDRIATCYAATGKKVYTNLAHPALQRSMARSKSWRMTIAPTITRGRNGRTARSRKFSSMNKTKADRRYTASFRWEGPVDVDGALALGLPVKD